MNKIIQILIIDDDPAIRYLTKRSLKEYKSHFTFVIDEATNGKEGMQYISTASPLPDVILLDINMPVMDGFEFLDGYKKYYFLNGQQPDIYILSTAIKEFTNAPAPSQNLVKGVFEKPLTEDHIDVILKSLGNFYL
jgi:CheY-like chemotaxis protein